MKDRSIVSIVVLIALVTLSTPNSGFGMFKKRSKPAPHLPACQGIPRATQNRISELRKRPINRLTEKEQTELATLESLVHSHCNPVRTKPPLSCPNGSLGSDQELQALRTRVSELSKTSLNNLSDDQQMELATSISKIESIEAECTKARTTPPCATAKTGLEGARAQADASRALASKLWVEGSTQLSRELFQTRLSLEPLEIEVEKCVRSAPPATAAARDKEAHRKRCEDLRVPRDHAKAQINSLLGAILDDPRERQSYLETHKNHPENLVEIINNGEAQSPLGAAMAATLLFRDDPDQAIGIFSDRFSNRGTGGAEGFNAKINTDEIERDKLKMGSLVKEWDHFSRLIHDPEVQKLREIRADAQSFTSSSEFEGDPGAATEDGLLSAVEGSVHYDRLKKDIPAAGYLHFKPLSARTGGKVNYQTFQGLSELVHKQFEEGKETVAVVVGDGDHWVAMAFHKKDRRIDLVDSLQRNTYFKDEELQKLGKLFKSTGLLDRTSEIKPIKTGQQREGHNCMIFSLLNAHQIAKRNDTEAYKEVSASLAKKTLRNYESISRIGKERLQTFPDGYGESSYSEFMNDFRSKTIDLLHHYSFNPHLLEASH